MMSFEQRREKKYQMKYSVDVGTGIVNFKQSPALQQASQFFERLGLVSNTKATIFPSLCYSDRVQNIYSSIVRVAAAEKLH